MVDSIDVLQLGKFLINWLQTQTFILYIVHEANKLEKYSSGEFLIHMKLEQQIKPDNSLFTLLLRGESEVSCQADFWH